MESGASTSRRSPTRHQPHSNLITIKKHLLTRSTISRYKTPLLRIEPEKCPASRSDPWALPLTYLSTKTHGGCPCFAFGTWGTRQSRSSERLPRIRRRRNDGRMAQKGASAAHQSTRRIALARLARRPSCRPPRLTKTTREHTASRIQVLHPPPQYRHYQRPPPATPHAWSWDPPWPHHPLRRQWA